MKTSSEPNHQVPLSKTLKCRVCRVGKLEGIISLGNQPLANALSKSSSREGPRAPLGLVRCVSCGTTQLDVDISPPEMFNHYLWVTGTSPSTTAHCQMLTEQALSRFSGSPRSVLEIASNDGTLLEFFQSRKIEVLGIDPARNLADQASQKGIRTLPQFFSDEVAKDVEAEEGKFDIVIARNVLSHVPDPADLVRGMSRLLSPSGVAIVEFHRADVILDELHYDSIYHEHSLYHSFKSMSQVLAGSGLAIFDAIASPISGGSWIVFASHSTQGRLPSNVLAEIVKNEQRLELNNGAAWHNFANRVLDHKAQMESILRSEVKVGHKIMAFGASARSSTLLNYWFDGAPPVEAILDSNPEKQGLFSPGTGIPILSPHEGLKRSPDSVLLLAFNFAEELKSLLRAHGWSGTLISPLPGLPEVSRFS